MLRIIRNLLKQLEFDVTAQVDDGERCPGPLRVQHDR
jgi:hypothetical protein